MYNNRKDGVVYPGSANSRAARLDAELSVLRARRAKLGLVKGEMMGVLLGGEVGLRVNSANLEINYNIAWVFICNRGLG